MGDWDEEASKMLQLSKGRINPSLMTLQTFRLGFHPPVLGAFSICALKNWIKTKGITSKSDEEMTRVNKAKRFPGNSICRLHIKYFSP